MNAQVAGTVSGCAEKPVAQAKGKRAASRWCRPLSLALATGFQAGAVSSFIGLPRLLAQIAQIWWLAPGFGSLWRGGRGSSVGGRLCRIFAGNIPHFGLLLSGNSRD